MFWAAMRRFCSVQRLAGGGKSISKQLRAGRRGRGRQRAVAVVAAGGYGGQRAAAAGRARVVRNRQRRAAAALLSATLL